MHIAEVEGKSVRTRTRLRVGGAAVRFAAWAGIGALLSCAHAGPIGIPAAVCLIAALGSSLPALCICLGIFAGLLLPETRIFAIFGASTGILTLTVCWSAREWIADRPERRSAVSAAIPSLMIAALMASADSFSFGSTAAWFCEAALAPVGTLCVYRWLHGKDNASLLAVLFAVVSGAAAIPLPYGFSLGTMVAAAVLSVRIDREDALPAAVLMGLALDWSRDPGTSAAAALAAGAVAARYFPGWPRKYRFWLFTAVCGLTVLFCGNGGGGFFLSAVLGGVAGLLLPCTEEPEQALPVFVTPVARLTEAAQAMEEMYRQLDDAERPDPTNAIAEVFDRAASHVCARCARHGDCWKRGDRTAYRTLRKLGPVFWAKGKTEAEDFPPEFAEKCRHFPALCGAIDAALDECAAEQQTIRRRNEQRAAAAVQYRVLSDYLRALTRDDPPRCVHFTAEAACRGRGRNNAPVSGDKAMWFRCGAKFHLMLCDGMGTGESAAQDSKRAVSLLSHLLRSGLDTENAIETLNLLAVLREDGGFAAVDLVEIDLETGNGLLIRWGGGDSFLRRHGVTERIGTAALPPGLSVGGTQDAQRIRLSLGNGEVLVLTSDGVGGEEAERRIRASREETARELAEGILESAASGEADDRMAAVLRLHPLSA